MRIRSSCAVALVTITAGFQLMSEGSAQSFPTKPIRYILPSSGSTEILARLMAQGMTEVLGQQVFVDVRTGASGNIGAELAARAPADGYTVLQAQQSHTLNVSFFRSLTYDFLRDFSAVTQTDSVPNFVVVHPSLPVMSIRDLVSLTKKRPGMINYASAGNGSATFLAAELFKMVAGINLVEVPYRGGGPAQTAVISGEVSVYFAPIATALPFVQERRLRALAITASKRVPMLPDYPTVSESGYPGYEFGGWHGLVSPAKTPREIIAKIHAAAVATLNRPDINKRMRDLGFTIIGNRPDEFAEFMKADVEKWRKVVLEKGLTAD